MRSQLLETELKYCDRLSLELKTLTLERDSLRDAFRRLSLELETLSKLLGTWGLGVRSLTSKLKPPIQVLIAADVYLGLGKKKRNSELCCKLCSNSSTLCISAVCCPRYKL